MDHPPHNRTPHDGYSARARLLHWTVALAVIAALALGLWMTRLPAGTEPEVARIFRVYSLHKTLGLSALGLGLLRVGWTVANPGPDPLHPDRKFEIFLARLTHACLSIGMVALPVTGLLHHSAAPGFAPILWPFGQALPFVPADEALALVFRRLHELAGWLLMVALAAHIAGVAKHSLLDRDSTLARMVTGNGTPPPSGPGPNPKPAIATAVLLWGAVIVVGAMTAPEPEGDPFDDFPEDSQPLD
jgi:cytochrome b561